MRWIVVLLLVAILGRSACVAEPFAPVATLDGGAERDRARHGPARDARAIAAPGSRTSSCGWCRRRDRGLRAGDRAVPAALVPRAAASARPRSRERPRPARRASPKGRPRSRCGRRTTRGSPRFSQRARGHASRDRRPDPADPRRRLGGAHREARRARSPSSTASRRTPSESGVQVGDEFFPGVAGMFADANLRVAVFALRAGRARRAACGGRVRRGRQPPAGVRRHRREAARASPRRRWSCQRRLPVAQGARAAAAPTACRTAATSSTATCASTASCAPRRSCACARSAARARRSSSGRAASSACRTPRRSRASPTAAATCYEGQVDRPPDPPRLRPRLAARQPGAGVQRGARRASPGRSASTATRSSSTTASASSRSTAI